MGRCSPQRGHGPRGPEGARALAPPRPRRWGLPGCRVRHGRLVAAGPGDDRGPGITGGVLATALRLARKRRLPGAAGRSPPGAAGAQPPPDRWPRLAVAPAPPPSRVADGGLPARGAEPCGACVSAAARAAACSRWPAPAAAGTSAGAEARHAPRSAQRSHGPDGPAPPPGSRAGRTRRPGPGPTARPPRQGEGGAHRRSAAGDLAARAPVCRVPQSRALDDDDHEHSRDGDRGIERPLQGRAVPAVPPLAPTRRGRRRRDNAGTVDARPRGQPVAGVAWTAIAGLAERPARIVLSASGLARSRGPSAKPWGRWLGLAPHPKQAGGRVPSSATRPGGHRAAPAWRLAAQHLQRAPRALGAFCRRMAARRGLAQAITAPAEKLARLIEARLQHGRASVAQGLAADALAYRERGVRQMTRKAAALGLMRVARDVVAQPS